MLIVEAIRWQFEWMLEHRTAGGSGPGPRSSEDVWRCRWAGVWRLILLVPDTLAAYHYCMAAQGSIQFMVDNREARGIMHCQ